MAVYQDRAKERIKKKLKKYTDLAARSAEQKVSEADTRQIIVRILDDMLGWDEFNNLTGEQMIRGKFADFVLKNKDGDLAVIEAKQASVRLKEIHAKQACDYAINMGLEWVVLTNSVEWIVYRIEFKKGSAPEIDQVFSVKLSDEKMKRSDKVELLYLLTEEASRKNELADYSDRCQALSAEQLVAHIMTKEVLDKVRLAIKRKSGHNIDNYEVACALAENVFANDCTPENLDGMLRKIKNS